MTQKLNDGEEQVCLVGLRMFLQHLMFWQGAKTHHPANDLDILASSHSRAHVITAIQKISGQPITHAFQNPHPAQMEAKQKAALEARTEIIKVLSASYGMPRDKAETLLEIATLQK